MELFFPIEFYVIDFVFVGQFLTFDRAHPAAAQLHVDEQIHGAVEGVLFRPQFRLTAVGAGDLAVDEETVRLRSHFEQMNDIMKSGGSIGRKLDFIVQEMNREANTIGSKVTDAQLAHKVVDIKAELEKIREQIQNIE